MDALVRFLLYLLIAYTIFTVIYFGIICVNNLVTSAFNATNPIQLLHILGINSSTINSSTFSVISP